MNSNCSTLLLEVALDGSPDQRYSLFQDGNGTGETKKFTRPYKPKDN